MIDLEVATRVRRRRSSRQRSISTTEAAKIKTQAFREKSRKQRVRKWEQLNRSDSLEGDPKLQASCKSQNKRRSSAYNANSTATHLPTNSVPQHTGNELQHQQPEGSIDRSGPNGGERMEAFEEVSSTKLSLANSEFRQVAEMEPRFSGKDCLVKRQSKQEKGKQQQLEPAQRIVSLIFKWSKLGKSSSSRRANCSFQRGQLSLLLLSLFLLLSNCLLGPLEELSSKRSFAMELVEAATNTTSSPLVTAKGLNLLLHTNYKLHDDEDADRQQSAAAGGDEQGSGGDNDNFTQIPLDNNSENEKTTTTAPTTTSTTTKRPAQQSKRAQIRVTETELLPFADFNVQQPAFSDLMRSWPPTTSSAQESNRKQHQQSDAQTNRQRQQQLRFKQQHQSDPSSADSDLELELTNHLNEDLDDTFVTADQKFERDQMPEPPTWINYLGDLGDYIYVQLRQHLDRIGQQADATSLSSAPNPESSIDQSSQQQQLKLEAIDEFLDDYYYDQYENSQVLYYGAQLVHEGDTFEIGCYMPNDQQAEWTKSGRSLASNATGSGSASSAFSPRVVRRSDFLGAKQNFTLKIFEAAPSDSGNYRCNRMSRKYHKLVVVPLKTSIAQLYVIQQRLLSVVNPKAMSSSAFSLFPFSRFGQQPQNGDSLQRFYANQQPTRSSLSSAARSSKRANYLLPGYLIVEAQPLLVSCNISDEFVLRRLREHPQFQLAWFKNGKQLRGSLQAQAQSSQSAARIRQQQSSAVQPLQLQQSTSGSYSRASNQRIQFLQPNGRQLYISSALYSDAGDYLCSWSRLPVRQEEPSDEGRVEFLHEPSPLSDEQQSGQSAAAQAPLASNPLAAGSLVQLMAPVKLRPFKSGYHVRQADELRLVCLLQRGFPPAYISWYVGNRLVDAEFLRQHSDEFRILQLHNQNQLSAASSGSAESQAPSSQPAEASSSSKRRIVEINPIPAGRQQMQMTANGRGQWIEYRDPKNERYSIGTSEQQAKYLKQKLAQLTGFSPAGSGGSQQQHAGSGSTTSTTPDPSTASLFSQTSISVLVISSLNIERHSSRYACRATTRANTDEVTTVIKVQASSTVSTRPSNGRATLIPGQPLHFQCEMLGNENAEFLWYRRALNSNNEEMLEPNNDDTIEIHNERLTLHKPTYHLAGDYICRALKKDSSDRSQGDPNEFATIKLRSQPYIEDFGLYTSHTGRSSIITDGDRLELNCIVRDTSAPVNITWLRSMTPDDERSMVPLPETPASVLQQNSLYLPQASSSSPQSNSVADPFAQTFIAPEQNIVIERLSSHSKRLIIESIRHEHRSYYVCLADNGVTEKSRKVIFIRVKDKLIALWPFLGIVAELFILFTIIHIWETQRAYKELQAVPQATSSVTTPTSSGSRRPVSGGSAPFESVPLTSG